MTKAKLPQPDDFDENPEWTEADFRRARPAADVLPELFGPEVAARMLRKPGRPKADAVKVPVTMRLDGDVLEHFKSTGRGWQTRINETLRAGMKRAKAGD